MPAYNASATIERAVQSVLDQTFPEWELIVVDDASTDATADVLRQFEDPRIRAIRQPVNRERSVARNTAIAASHGQYICFLDSDDRYLSPHLSVLHRWLTQHDLPVVMTFTRVLCESPSGEQYERPFDADAFIHPERHILGRTPIHISAVCIHTDIFRSARFDERLGRAEDSDLWLQVGEQFEIIGIDEHTCVYTRPDSDYHSTDAARSNYEVRLRDMRTRGSRLKSSPLVSRRDRRLIHSRAHLGLANIHRNERPWAAVWHAALALLNSPRERTKEGLLLLLAPIRH
ncbi:MAG: hypothetical protein QOH79_1809 [Acidimicrobiaceae bacterium]